MPLLEVSGVHKAIRDQPVLQGVSLQLEAGENLAIAGETGSGKSTLLKIIAGFTQADAGAVYFQGKRVPGPEEKLIPGHPSIAYLSQHFELRNNYRVEELMEYANHLPGDQFERIIENCQIGHLLKRRTDQLSGGEKQRIATARLLVGEPELLILDEPYSNLDMPHRQTMKEVIRTIQETQGITCILVSHEPFDILSWADRLLVMRDGQWVQQGRPQEIYEKPADAYTAGMLGPSMAIEPALALASGLIDRPVSAPLLHARPEAFSILEPGQGAIARLLASRFAGAIRIHEVLWESQHLIVYSTDNTRLAPGQEIGLQLTLSR